MPLIVREKRFRENLFLNFLYGNEKEEVSWSLPVRKEKGPWLIVIAGPSGAGKTTLYDKLLADHWFAGKLAPSISYTTRPPRPGEINGVHYHFITKRKFNSYKKKDLFVESFSVHKHSYGTLRSSIEGPWEEGKSVLRIVDVQGARALTEVFPKKIKKVFIAPRRMAELERRMEKRPGSTPESIALRLKNAEQEMEDMPQFELVVYNGDGGLDFAYHTLRQVVSGWVL